MLQQELNRMPLGGAHPRIRQPARHRRSFLPVQGRSPERRRPEYWCHYAAVKAAPGRARCTPPPEYRDAYWQR